MLTFEIFFQFEPIKKELALCSDPTLKFTYGVPQLVELNYQEPPPPGKGTGRYINQQDINQEDKGDVVDNHFAAPVQMHDGRELVPAASLETMGFQLQSWPSACTNFHDDAQVVDVYYNEMIQLVKATSGAQREIGRAHV